MLRTFECPKCGQPMQFDDSEATDRIDCPACHRGVRLKRPASDPAGVAGLLLERGVGGPRSMVDGAPAPPATILTLGKAAGSSGERPELDAGDLRPMIPRNTTNSMSFLWQKRDEIYGYFMKACDDLGIKALVLKSYPYSTTTWVKFECWLPHHSARALSDRSSVLINLRPWPYHRYEYGLDIDLQDGLKPRKYNSVVSFTQSDALAIIRYLLRENDSRSPDFRLALLREHWWQLWRDRNKVTRLRTDVRARVATALLWTGAIGLLLFPPIALILLGAGGVLAFFNSRRRGYVLSCGKPPEEPRDLVAKYKWRVLIPDLAEKAEDLKKDMRRELLRGKVDEAIHMAEERIWYWGLDGKEEREQLAATFRRGIAFIQVYPYDKDVSVSWDSYLNIGTWGEEDVATGVDVVTGEFTRVKTIKALRQAASEYEVADLECLTEWVHNAMVKVVKRYIDEYHIDMEIDFRINRDRDNLPGDRSDRERSDGGALSRVRSFFQRQA